jgi:tRNA dimethylallyltransferase
MMKHKKVIVILGPTATGKSDLAVEIAKKINGEVISADSRQVYIGLDIGTGKITEKEMKGIPHHLINVVSPKKKFTVVEYKRQAKSAIINILEKGKVPIICGGTGFYIDSVTKGIVFPEVEPNIKLRKILEKKEVEELFKILQKLDKNRAKNIKDKNEINNKVRLIRAIEIVKAIGKVPKIKEERLPYQFIKIGLYLPDDISREKINKRVNKMFKDGLLLEVRNLNKKGISKKRLKEFGFEYNDPTIEKVISETFKYVKRQITWFKRDEDIVWFDASKNNFKNKIISIVKKEVVF